MGLGILEPSRVETVPGTTYIYDDASRPTHAPQLESPQLKYDRSGAVPIILVP